MSSISEAAVDPQNMPEIQREITMLRGAVEALNGKTRELVDRVQPIVRQDEGPDKAIVVREADFPLTTDVSKSIADIRSTVSRLEEAVEYTLYRVQV